MELKLIVLKKKKYKIEGKEMFLKKWMIKDKKAISARWIRTEKVKKGKRKIKARLVAKGFEEEEITETDSPTCAQEALRTTIMIIGNKGWNCNRIDIKTAYLQGKEMERRFI